MMKHLIAIHSEDNHFPLLLSILEGSEESFKTYELDIVNHNTLWLWVKIQAQ